MELVHWELKTGLGAPQVRGDQDRREQSLGIAVLADLCVLRMCHPGPMALKLRPNLIEDVERCLYFRFNVWPWQFIAKTDTKAVWKSLEKGQTLPVPREKGNWSHAATYLRCLQHALLQGDMAC